MNSSTRPRRWRSSGMWPIPSSRCLRTLALVTSSSPTTTRPDSGFRNPVSASISSDCPFPSTPAIPTISPARTSNETSRTAGSPRSSTTERFSTTSIGLPGAAGFLSTLSRTSRPTIIRARPASVAPSRGIVSTCLPRRSVVIRSEISKTSSSLWVMKMTESPSAISPRRISNSSLASCGVSTAVGSSRMRMSALR